MPRRKPTTLIAQRKVRPRTGQYGSKGDAWIPAKVLRIAGAAHRQWTQGVTA